MSLSVVGRKEIHLPLFGAVPVFLLSLFLLFIPEPGAVGMRDGLLLCGRAVIPSLFPFLVLTPFLAYYGQCIPSFPLIPLTFAVGMTTGFPLGAVTAAALYENGALDRDTAERALAVCSGSGPAFLVGCAGKALYGSAKIGWVFFGAQLASSLLLYVLFLRGRHGTGAFPQKAPPAAVSAIGDAVPKMLSVCAFVLFFSVLRSYLSALLGALSVPSAISAFSGGLLEMTGGISALSACAGSDVTGCGYLPLSAFLIGFGGLSVLWQTRAAAESANLSLRYYPIVKLLCGSFCFLFSSAAVIFGVV